MDDLRTRFASLDRIPAPDLRSRIEARATALGTVQRVTAATVRGPRGRSARGARRMRLLPFAIALAAAIVAVAVGSGLVSLPSILPAEASPSPTVSGAPLPTRAPTVTPSQPVWMSGQELMDTLSASYGYTWTDVVVSGGTRMRSSEAMQVQPPFGAAAKIGIAWEVDSVTSAAIQAHQVGQELAPDVLPWLDEALANAIIPNSAFASSTLTATGGQVVVNHVDELYLQDWVSVSFIPEPLPLRGPPTAGIGAVAYEDAGAVWLVDPDGRSPGKVLVSGTHTDGVRQLVGWSSDGSQLLYEDGSGDVWVTDPGWASATPVGGHKRDALCPVAPVDGNCQAYVDEAAVSPDGRHIAYPLLEGRDLDISTIAVFDMTTSAVSRLDSTRVQQGPCTTASSGTNGRVQWSPDGRRLVFDRQGMGPKLNGQCQATIFTVGADGANLRRLVAPEVAAVVPQWSPDGSRIAFQASGPGESDIYTVRPDGSDLARLTDDGISVSPVWTRDGRIVFIRWTSADGELWIMDADGGGATRLQQTFSALTAAGCVICPYPGHLRATDSIPNLAFWQPNP